MSVRYQRTRAGLTTAPRIAAMTVLVRVDRINCLARRSNETNERASMVYWQTADWLVERGYAQLDLRRPDGEFLTLTDLGRETAQLCEIGD